MTAEPKVSTPRVRADIAIIGTGASGTHVLMALLAKLSSVDEELRPPTHIVLIDRDSQHFCGVAYGGRSGRGSLTLSSLRQFLPDDERTGFIGWLNQHRDKIVSNPDIDRGWIDRHREEITAGRWDHLCIPRRLYGEYLTDRTNAAIRQARLHGVAEVEFFTATVTSVRPNSNSYRITMSTVDGRLTEIDSAVAILAIGSPPAQGLPRGRNDTAAELVHDIYRSGLDTTLKRVQRRLESLPEYARRILVVGGNAAALEFVLACKPMTRQLGARLTVLAPLGRPQHWRKRRPDEVGKLIAVTALRKYADAGGTVTAEMLYQAVVSDMRAAVASGTNIASVPEIVAAIPHLLATLDEDERAIIAARYGMAISALLREDCGDAIDTVDALVAAGVLDFEAGRYDGPREGYGVIVAATGFDKVSATSDPLLRQLLRDGIVRTSSSDAGLTVDSRFRAGRRLFVIGPLLAGNSNAGMLIWHAESVRRIIWIANTAAPHIVGAIPKPRLHCTEVHATPHVRNR